MYKRILDVPTGKLVTVYTGCLRCTGCGTVIYNASYDARATDRYSDAMDGRLRREFVFEGGSPFCSCDDSIWLSDDDLPYLADGWPVAAKEECELPDAIGRENSDWRG